MSKPTDKATWPELNLWFALTLENMHAVFSPIVKHLDAADYNPPANDVDGVMAGPPDGSEQPA